MWYAGAISDQKSKLINNIFADLGLFFGFNIQAWWNKNCYRAFLFQSFSILKLFFSQIWASVLRVWLIYECLHMTNDIVTVCTNHVHVHVNKTLSTYTVIQFFCLSHKNINLLTPFKNFFYVYIKKENSNNELH